MEFALRDVQGYGTVDCLQKNYQARQIKFFSFADTADYNLICILWTVYMNCIFVYIRMYLKNSFVTLFMILLCRIVYRL